MALFLSLAGLVTIVLQMILPKLPLLEVRPYLVILPVLYGAMRLRGPKPFYVAVFLGSVIDILSPQKFGTGGFVLCMVVAIAWSQRENFNFSRYGSVFLLALLATFGGLILDYALFGWQSGNWDWRFTIWVRMVWVALLNLALAGPFFLICDLVLVRWLKLLAEPEVRYAI